MRSLKHRGQGEEVLEDFEEILEDYLNNTGDYQSNGCSEYDLDHLSEEDLEDLLEGSGGFIDE